MSKKIYVYSTLASDVNYTNYMHGANDMPMPAGSVVIKGGAGVANDRLITPRGVVTEISEQDFEHLEQNPVFQKHRENGFIEVSDVSVDPDKAAADMAGRDMSAPLVPQDLKPEEKPAAVGGTSPEEYADTETPSPPRGARRGRR